MEHIYDLKILLDRIKREKGVLIYFSNAQCHVCKVLKPKVIEMMQETYPGMALLYVDTELSPVLAGQHRVFTIPTILIFFEGKEHQRLSRNISLHQLEDAISKPYRLLIEN